MRTDLPGLEQAIEGTAANGVPFVALPPESGMEPQALILLWHGADPPKSEEALAAAVPLRSLAAWRVYLGMPLYGRRYPTGGFDEIMRLGAQDAVRLIFQPAISGAVNEFPAALDSIRSQLGIAASLPLGIFGFSQGGAAALLTVARQPGLFKAAMAIGAVVDLHAIVDTIGAMFGATYPWDEESRAIALELSTVQRASTLAASGAAILLAIGQEDPLPVREPSEHLVSAINTAGGSAEIRILAGVAHAFVDPPGQNPAPQGVQARAADDLASTWFKEHLLTQQVD